MRSKKAIINIISLLLFQATTIICGFIVPKLIISNYGSNVNGLIASINRFLAYITVLEIGFGTVIKALLYKPIAKKDKDEIVSILKATDRFYKKISLIFIGYIIILCIIFPLLVAKEFDYLFTIPLILILSFSVFIDYFYGITYKTYLYAEQKAYVSTFINLIVLIVNTIVVVILIKLGLSVHIVKLVTALLFVLRPVIQNIYVRKKYKIDIRKVKTNRTIKQKWDGLAQHIAYVVRVNTDIIVLSLFSSLSEVSVYYVYSLITTSVRAVLENISGGLEASFGDMIAKKENKQLNRSFRIYELLFFTLTAIIFICTYFLIVPFVQVYTKNITDVNYVRPFFAVILVTAELLFVFRLPYSEITLAAGKFKEIRIPALVEAGINVILSVVFVAKYGIMGVTMGTLLPMIIRTIHFMYYSSKYILKRRLISAFKYFAIVGVEILVVYLIMKVIPEVKVTSYLQWMIQAIKVFAITFITVITINTLTCFNQTKESIEYLKEKIKK